MSTKPKFLKYPDIEDYIKYVPTKDMHDSYWNEYNRIDMINKNIYEANGWIMMLCNFLNMISFRPMVASVTQLNSKAKCYFKSCPHKIWFNTDNYTS